MNEREILIDESPDCELVSSRVFDAPRELVFRAFTDPNHLRHWWGPKGFTNTFYEFDPRPGGVWRFVMHGPDGTNYKNKSIFAEIVKPGRIVLKHVSSPVFQLTIALTEEKGETRVKWNSLFESAEQCEKVKSYAAEANEQNFDRLASELEKMRPIIVEQIFNAPIEFLWKAITDTEQMRQWYFESLDSFKPEIGFQTQVNVRCGDMDYLHLWSITEVVPLKKLSYVWKYGGHAGDSLVTFELLPDNNQTKLRLTHYGVDSFPRDNPSFARERFVEGWNELIGKRLKEYSEESKKPKEKPFIISRVIDAPRDLVWKAWTERDHMQWWGPKGVTVQHAKLELRAGGLFHYCLRTADGHDMWGKWVIREIAKPDRLVFVDSFSDESAGLTRHPMSADWPLEIHSTVEFVERDGKTLLTIHWLPLNATEAECKTFNEGHESMKGGWTGTLDRLTEYLAKTSNDAVRNK